MEKREEDVKSTMSSTESAASISNRALADDHPEINIILLLVSG